FCGLKDKQGRTEQLIAVDGAEVDFQEPDLRLKPLGRTGRPLSAENTTSNRFSVTARALTEEDLSELPRAAAEVNRLGVVNYFDSQRFGSLKHGQGFIAKDLLRGDFEAALRNHLAKPSPLDRSDDAKVKEFWRRNWGDWGKRAPWEAAHRYDRVIRSLREKPEDYLRAFLQIDAAYRALLLFTYQSCLWNERVRRLLQISLPREALFPLRYQAGTLLFHRDADPQTLRWLRELTFPLLAPGSQVEEPRVREAVDWVLGKEKLRLEQLRGPGAERLLYFKHEERGGLVQPGKLVLERPPADEPTRGHSKLNRGHSKLNVAFTLPPGSYATLVVKRLFHRTAREDTPEEIQALSARTSSLTPRPGFSGSAPQTARTSSLIPRSGFSGSARDGDRGGFRARAKARKEAKAAARARQKLRQSAPASERGRPRSRPCRQLHAVGGNRPGSTGVWVDVTTLLSSWLPSPAALGSILAEPTEIVPYRAEVRAARRGDRSAFETLVRSVQRPVYGLCLPLLRTEAEAAEVAQESFLRAYQHLGRYDESKPFDLWVLAIARNLCLDLLRRRSRVHTQDVDEMQEALPSGERSQEEGVIAAEEHRSLEAALATLGPDDREVLAL